MKTRSIAPAAAISLLASSLTLMVGTPALSSSSFGIDYYVSAPFVQNTYIDLDAPTTYFEDFDARSCTSGNGLVNTATVSWIASTSCAIVNADQYGGALSTSSSPVVGSLTSPPAGKKYARPVGGGSITVSFSVPMKYIGFWWSAGSNGNRIDFYKDGVNVLTLTTAAIFALFEEGKPTTTNQAIDASKTITFDGPVSYPKGHYYGNPWAHTSLTPTNSLPNTVTAAYNEPFTYLHLFANGSFDFDQVVLSGGGFEFDNFVASSVTQVPNLTQIYQVGSAYPTVTFNNNAGSGSMNSQSSSESRALTANSFQRTGFSFLGWNTQADGQGTTYSDQAVFNFLSTLTLYAQWGPNYLEFDPNGGSGSLTTQSGTVSATLSPNLFERSGFQFNGWNTEADGYGIDFADQSTFSFTYSARLFAKWLALATPTPPSQPSYKGPLPTCVPVSLSTPTFGSTFQINGSRLNSISSGSIDGKAIQIISKTDSSLTIGLPSLEPGSYEIALNSEQGNVVLGNCLSIRTAVPPASNDGASTASPVTKSPEAQAKPYTATKRFYTFIGDKGQLVNRDVRAIQRWLASLEGIESVTCMGSTSGIPAASTDPALARTRARNACALVSRLVPEASIRQTILTGRGVGQFFRAVQITVRGQVRG